MTRPDIIRFSALRGVVVEGGHTLFQTLMQAVQGVLNVDEHRALDICKVRISNDRNAEHFAEQLLNLDEAISLIDTHDKEVYKEETNRAEMAQESMDGFVEEFRLMRQGLTTQKRKKGEDRPN